MNSTNVINTIVKNDLCCGCGVCSGICPQKKLVMKFNEYGEYIPFQEKECPKICGVCLNVCPFHDQNTNETELGKSLYEGIRDIEYLPETGYYLDSYAGYSANFRQNSSSGGMTTWLLTTLLREKLVDYVIAVTACPNPDQVFQYTIFEDEKSVLTSSGSVYYPVEMSNVIRTILDKPGHYAIVGLPCFLKGLRYAAQKIKKLNERISVTVGLVCGQMKSKHYTAYLSTLTNAGGKLRKVHFRGKSSNKPASNFYFYCVNENGDEGKIFFSDGVAQAWINRWFTLNACNYCDDVFAELADVTFMDAWLPEYSSDSRGTNLTIVRNPFINDLILKGSTENQINIDKISIKKVIESQQGVIDLKQRSISYRLYLAKIKGLKVPNKRIDMSNKINLFKKQDIKIKYDMQKASKYLFIANYKENGLNIENFRSGMQIYLIKMSIQKTVFRIFTDAYFVIKKIKMILS